MPVYHVVGVTLQGEKVEQVIEANNRDEVLKQLPKAVGRLRSNFQIVKVEQLDNMVDYLSKKNRRYEPLLSDEEVIEVAKRINANTATTEDWNLFRAYFMPMIKAAIRELWNGIVKVTSEEKELELLNNIAKNFIPRYDPDRKMHLRAFIKLQIKGKLKKDWSREMYINSNSGKKRLRRSAEYEYAQKQLTLPKKIGREELRLKMIGIGKRIAVERVSLKKSARIEFFSEIVSADLHREFLNSEVQIDTMELSYRDGYRKGVDVAKLRGVSTQSANGTRQSAEKNILKYIRKNF